MATGITYPFNCWMGLQAAGAEVSGVGYVRRPAAFEDTGEDGIGANASSVQWPTCGSDWGLIDTVNLYDALTGGNLLCTGAATTPVRGNLYDELRVSAGGYAVFIFRAPLGFGTLTWGTGRYATRGVVTMASGGLGSPYDVGGYGVGPYEMLQSTVLLLRTFGTVALCGNQPGDWVPSAPCEAGAWTPAALCEPGAWAPGQFDVVAS
jgi:hypothetical protein